MKELNRGSEIKNVKWKAKHSIREVRLKRDEATTVYVYGASYRIRKGKANEIEDYVCGERAGRKLERDTGRAEETCGKKRTSNSNVE